MKLVKSLGAALVVLFSFSAIGLAATGNFLDEDTFSDWYASSVQKLATAGVIQGNTDGTFRPGANVNRAELAVMFDRFSSEVVGVDLPEEELFCTLELRSSLVLNIYDQSGADVSDAVITVDGKDADFSEGDSGVYAGLYEGEGYYELKVEKAGYRDYIETIKLEQDTCHVIPQTRTIVLVEA